MTFSDIQWNTTNLRYQNENELQMRCKCNDEWDTQPLNSTNEKREWRRFLWQEASINSKITSLIMWDTLMHFPMMLPGEGC